MLKKIGLYLMGLLYIAAGINHFINPEFYLKLMPPYLPLHYEAVMVSGIAEVVLGFLLFLPTFRRWAAWGIIILLIVIFPANIHMALHYEDFHVSALIAYARLPLQLVLIAWAYVYAKR
jgi:uncharacterized membrane protein